jgi:hypothetical protein
MPGQETEEAGRSLGQLWLDGVGEQPSAMRRSSSGSSYFAGPAPEERAFLLPLRVPRGGYQSEPGTWARFVEGLAVPGIIHEPFRAANMLLQSPYRPGQRDEEGVQLALQAAGLTGAGAIATRPAGALASGTARRQRLSMDADSRFARGRDMGFNMDETLYHGTTRSFRAFDLSRAPLSEQAVWLTPHPEVAGHFAKYRAEGGWFRGTEHARTRILPLRTRGRQRVIDRDYLQREYGELFARRLERDPENFVSPLEAEGGAMFWNPEIFRRELERARRDGFDSVRFVRVEEGMGPPADQVAVFNPANIRSTNARFNPRFGYSANLLSANPPPALLAAGTQELDER